MCLCCVQEAEKLEPGEDSSNFTCYDYSEKRSLPITIPDYTYSERGGDRYVAFNVCMAGRCVVARVWDRRVGA